MKPLLKLIFKLGLLGLPILVTLGTYIYFDPFMVLRKYTSYNETNGIELNRDYVSTEIFLRNYEREMYDSFIFGNSRTIAFTTTDWRKWIAPAKPYHFDASLESNYGISGKLDLIDSKGGAIRNALFILDASVLKAAADYDEHLLKKHPQVSGKNAVAFQTVFAKAYLSPTFVLPYLGREISGKKVAWLPDPFRESTIEIDPLTNDMRAPDAEHEISANPEAYYRKHAALFFAREDKAGTELPAVIHEEQTKVLKHIQQKLQAHCTHYKLIIGPLYEQRKLHPDDLKILRELFGAENVCDFSGINDYTRDIHNYYEESHFRPSVGRSILECVYDPAR